MSDIDQISSDASDPGRVVLRRLTNRPQFLATAKGLTRPCGAVLIQTRDRADGDPAIGVGFTATRKLGGAVVRNRAKRRLREAARTLIPEHGLPGADSVLVARQSCAEREWPRWHDEVTTALIRLAADRRAEPPRP